MVSKMNEWIVLVESVVVLVQNSLSTVLFPPTPPTHSVWQTETVSFVVPCFDGIVCPGEGCQWFLIRNEFKRTQALDCFHSFPKFMRFQDSKSLPVAQKRRAFE
jgi:hypothetical protein